MLHSPPSLSKVASLDNTLKGKINNHLSVGIDTVVLDREHDVPSMQQMSEITGGIYSRVREPAMLLQTLLTYHLADDSARELLATIPQKIVDGRAICFNNKQTVDIGTCQPFISVPYLIRVLGQNTILCVVVMITSSIIEDRVGRDLY